MLESFCKLKMLWRTACAELRQAKAAQSLSAGCHHPSVAKGQRQLPVHSNKAGLRIHSGIPAATVTSESLFCDEILNSSSPLKLGEAYGVAKLAGGEDNLWQAWWGLT